MSNDTRRILLVEDEKAIRDAVAAYLQRENYQVVAVADGQEALEEFSRHHFDLVILDLMLPRVSRASAFAALFAIIPIRPSSCSRQKVKWRIASSVSNLVPMTIW